MVRLTLVLLGVLLATSAFAQEIRGFKADCVAQTADVSSGRNLTQGRPDGFAFGSTFSFPFAAARSERKETTLSISFTDGSKPETARFSGKILNLAKKAKLLAFRAQFGDFVVSRTADDYDRKNGMVFEFDRAKFSQPTEALVRATIQQSEGYIRRVECRLTAFD